MPRHVLAAALALAASNAASAPERSWMDDVGQGQLVIPSTSQAPRLFPLKHTDVDAEISGFVSRVTVKQTFHNPYNEVIEAIYVFPLPDNAAVDAMVMKIGGRVVRGIIQKRDEARATYERAKSRGQAAALLDQERPNVFTQSVANIRPGDSVEIEIRYAATLKYDNGAYEFHFPMVVGPRFVPGRPLQGDAQGTGWAPDSDRVPDGSRISPPVIPRGMRSAHDISLRVILDAGVPIQALRSPSHKIDAQQPDADLAEVALSPADTIPNKDFVLRWDVAGEHPAMGLLATRTERGGYFSLMIQPKARIRDEELAPRELVFVFDTSGSQMGAPLAKQREVVRQALGGMRRGDTFQILDFNERVTAWSREPLPFDGSNAERAVKYIDALQAGGGTFMLEAIQEVLRSPRDPKRVRFIVFLTDGYIGNDEDVLAAIQADLGEARLFTFGVGSSVNRYLIERMSEMGRGVAQVVRPDEETQAAVNRFHERIARPLLTDITIDWGNLRVQDVYPARIPDLFSAQPVIVNARYDAPGRGRVVLRGRLAGRPFEQAMDVSLPDRETRHASLGSVWARARIEDRERQMYRGEQQNLVREITELALRHELVTKWTSFVAVEDRVVNEGGAQRTVAVPVEMPEFVEQEGVFGDEQKIVGFGAGGGSAGHGTSLGIGGMGTRGSGRASAGPRSGRESYSPSPAPPPVVTADAPAYETTSEDSGGFLGRIFGKKASKDDAEVDRLVALEPAPAKAPPHAAPKRIQVGEVLSSGALAPAAFKARLESLLAPLHAALAGAPGEITLRLVVGADGKVARVEVLRSTFDAVREKQLVDAARKWTFLRAAVVLTVPLSVR